MSENTATDREMTEITLSLEFIADDVRDLSEELDGQTRNDYLGNELRKLYAIRNKLKYNIRKLERITGQSVHTQGSRPF